MGYLLDANVFIQAKKAQALAGKHTVVTHERAAPEGRKIEIPDACIGLGVKFMNPYEMLRRERARFVLAARS